MMKKAIFLILIVVLNVASFSQQYQIRSPEIYPKYIQQRLDEIKTQLASLGRENIGVHSLKYLLRKINRWHPGQVLKVAFLDGNDDFLKEIEETANLWCRYGNIKFDFKTADGNYRKWTREDTEYAAEIRISFDIARYWSLVGTDSTNPSIVKANEASMNFYGLHIYRPANWRAIVLHEFGHALGFMHEHQNPQTGCDSEFKWDDDPGYVPTCDGIGCFIADQEGRMPGVYRILGGEPNKLSREMIDQNLRHISNSRAYEYTLMGFDRYSIMTYFFPDCMYIKGKESHCFAEDNDSLSQGDIVGIKKAYPIKGRSIDRLLFEKEEMLEGLVEILNSPVNKSLNIDASVFENQLAGLKSFKK